MPLTDALQSPASPGPFWSEFVRDHWEQSSALLSLSREAGDALPTITSEELFPALVACGDEFWRNGGGQKIRFYSATDEIDLIRGRHRELLPFKDDGSFEGYHHRLLGEVRIRDYALMIADWHQFDRPLWERISLSLRGLSRAVGVSLSRVDTQAFVGDYRNTPFGVHRDPRSAFHFPVVGMKKMRFWPASAASRLTSLQRASRYEQFLADSVVTTARVGQAIYWPSSYWHVGESDGAFSAAWGFGYWLGDGLRALASDLVLEAWNDSQRTRGLTRVSRQAVTSVALSHLAQGRGRGPIDEILAELQHISASNDLRRSLVRHRLEQESAFGFLKLPAPIEAPPREGLATVRSKAMFPILMDRLSPDELCVAAAGRSCVVPHDPSVVSLIEKLNSGGRVLIGDDRPTAISALINFCVNSGAVTVEKATT